jgi:hypothetical protein
MKLIYLIEIATPRQEHESRITPSVCHTPAGATKPTPSDLALGKLDHETKMK